MRKPWSIFTILVLVSFASPVWAVAPQREDVKRILKRLEEDTDRYSLLKSHLITKSSSWAMVSESLPVVYSQ